MQEGDSSSSSSTERRNLEHLARLEERNRQKRLLSAKSREELDIESKERGFSTHFRGANASALNKSASTKRFSKVTTPSPQANSGLLLAVSRSKTETTPAGEGIPARKGWATVVPSSTRDMSSLSEQPEGDLSAALMQRIAGLDLTQQAKLYALLNGVGEGPNSEQGSMQIPSDLQPSRDDTVSSQVVSHRPRTGNASSLGTWDSALSIRIRIFSVWSSSKFASLSGIRLFLDDNDAHLDVFKYFKVNILCGLQLQSPLSDAVRDMPALFSQSFASAQVVWKGPVSADSPLEIRLQDIPDTDFVESHGGREGIAANLKIALWNAEETPLSNWSSKSLLPAAAKDVDIYVCDKCIWSGQLAPGNGDKPNSVGRGSSPTLMVPAFSSSSATTTTTIATATNATAITTNSDTSKMCGSPLQEFVAPRSLSSPDKKLPSWFDGLRETAAVGSIGSAAASFDKEGRTTPRPRSTRTPEGDTLGEISTSATTSSEKRRRRRRDPLELDKSPEERLNDVLTKPRSDGKTEEQLRVSISAMREADKQNRGRIGKSLFGGGEGVGDTDGDASDSINPLEGSTDSLHTHLTLRPSPPRVSPVTATTARGDDDSTLVGSAAKTLRNRRIDEVHNAVQNAVQSLAGIMSGLQHGNNRRLGEQSPSAPVEALEDSGNFFSVPVLPRGRTLRFEILSTWGDVHYVGLNGFDIFDHSGTLLTSNRGEKKSFNRPGGGAFIAEISGNPRDINVLPEYDNDPRTVTNLIEGTNFTRDDMHVWLAPLGFYSPDADESGGSQQLGAPVPLAIITIKFSEPTTLSMIRIFNYNKSRTYAHRGVRSCRIALDDAVIYAGEIRMAPGLLTSVDASSEVILFTTNESILAAIAKHDENAGYYMDDCTSQWVGKLMHGHLERPSTAEKEKQSPSGSLPKPVGPKTISRNRLVPAAYLPSTSSTLISTTEFRPSTSALVPKKLPAAAVADDLDDEEAFFAELRAALPPESPLEAVTAQESAGLAQRYTMRTSPISFEAYKGELGQQVVLLSSSDLVPCCAIALVIESSWGDPDYVGLTGISILSGFKCAALALDSRQITAVPRDLSSVGRFEDPRTPDKLLDSFNDTTDETHMWLVPFTSGSDEPYVRFEWNKTEPVAALRIWNYNKHGDELRGAKAVAVISYDDAGRGTRLGRCILRPAPGCDGVTFGQTIYLRDIINNDNNCSPSAGDASRPKYISPPLRQDYEVPFLPCGQLLKFTLIDNFGDGHYIGLDGIELFDEQNGRLVVDGKRATVTAVPHSLQDLGSSDPRTPEKLFFDAVGTNGAAPGEANHIPFLAPIARCMTKQEREAAGNRVQTTKSRDGVDKKDFSFYQDNVVFVLFAAPIRLSLVRIFNYKKDTGRGVKTLAIHIDGKLIYMGNLLPATVECSAQGSKGPERRGQSIVMTADPKIARGEKEKVPSSAGLEQDVLCIDERVVKVKSTRMYAVPTPFSDKEDAADYSNVGRPATSAGR